MLSHLMLVLMLGGAWNPMLCPNLGLQDIGIANLTVQVEAMDTRAAPA